MATQMDPSQIYLSCATPQNVSLGIANYSYRSILDGYTAALGRAKVKYKILDFPELAPFQRSPGLIHIRVGPPESVRLLKGAYNVLAFAWEFSRFPRASEVHNLHPFGDIGHVTSIIDEAWTLSRYSKDVIERNGAITRCVPTPILGPVVKKNEDEILDSISDINWVPLSIFPRLQYGISKYAHSHQTTIDLYESIRQRSARKVFLTVFNPHDLRKQAGPMIRAAFDFVNRNPDALFLIKCSSPDDDLETINLRLFTHQLCQEEILQYPMISNRILITNGRLSTDQLASLYQLSSFYVCTSLAEGQNIPLLEAMSYGVVPISVRHTSMLDYLNDENSVLIDCELQPAPRRIAKAYNLYDISVYGVREQAIKSALEYGLTMSDEAWHERSVAAEETVKSGFDGESLIERINEIRRSLSSAERTSA